MRIRPGLCSVTFRALEVERVLALAAAAGLEVIEWGGDVHVPAGDVTRAGEVARMTADTGLEVCSYGSYFRAGSGGDFLPALDSAEALGADRIRIWAGRIGSADAADDDWARVIADLEAAVDAAADRDLTLALEYHGGTLADTPASTRRLLATVPRLTTYWQPALRATDQVALTEYSEIADSVSAAHVFSWSPDGTRHPLTARDHLWSTFFAMASAHRPPRDALLEFLPGDDPALLAREAATLRGYLAAGTAEAPPDH